MIDELSIEVTVFLGRVRGKAMGSGPEPEVSLQYILINLT
jgi:hypothetical protein